MPTFPSFSRLSLVAASILATCSPHALCQTSALDYVPNLPYTAQIATTVVMTQADGTSVQRETKLIESRDSEGRTRIEDFSCGASRPVMVNLFFPLRRQIVQLIPGQKMARVITFPGTGPIPTHGLNPNAVKVTVEKLPGQILHGIFAEGTRTTQVLPAKRGNGPDVVFVEETWVSPDLKLMVLNKDTNTHPGSDQTTSELVRLDRSEPDAAFFEIPADYRIVEEPTGPR